MAKLVNVVFKNKVVSDKQDFYQIFNNLLPFDDEFNSNRRTNILGEKTEISFNVIDKQNNQNEVNNYNTTGALRVNPNNNIQNNNLTNYNLYESNTNTNLFNNTNNINNTNYNMNKNTNNNVNNAGRRRSRSINEIMIQVDEYMLYFGKRTASDLFKIFDQDANLRVGIKELADGFAKMGIALNPEELSIIWKHIVLSNTKDSFGIEEFMAFYEKNKVSKKKA